MKKAAPSPASGGFFRKHGPTVLILLLAAVLFLLLRLWAVPEPEPVIHADEYAEYDNGTVTSVLADSTEADPSSDGGFRGEQLLLVEVTTGQYTGETLQVYNYVGPLYGVPVHEGDSVTLIISTYADGSHRATVYEFDRGPMLIAVMAAFLLITALVGGKTGIKSIVGLAVTIACLFLILLPALIRGAATIPTAFLCCAYITVVCLVILGGIREKTVCAMIGAVAGVAAAMLFALLAQQLTRINALRVSDVEPLLQLRQSGSSIGLKGLLTAGIMVSTLGAVMDVTMGISSALQEVHLANPALDRRALFRSGMNIGRDMVGTMTNTLILATIGGSFVLILYLYTLGLSRYQLLSSSYLSIEVISGLAGSAGVILSVPLTALTGAVLYGKKKQ